MKSNLKPKLDLKNNFTIKVFYQSHKIISFLFLSLHLDFNQFNLAKIKALHIRTCHFNLHFLHIIEYLRPISKYTYPGTFIFEALDSCE